jgi:Flp pilus assembly protein TadG
MVSALRFWRDQSGAAMVEGTIVMTVLLTLVLGFVDFGYAFYQWNAASKATKVGARLASIADPVADNTILTEAATANLSLVGVTMAPGSYDYLCTANAQGTPVCMSRTGTQTCATTTGWSTSGVNASAFTLIYDGDASRPGMHDFFPELTPQQVCIEYVATGLGFWTRPGGAIPTIRVSIVNHPFQFFFLGGLVQGISSNSFFMPDMMNTVTGEDLLSSAP